MPDAVHRLFVAVPLPDALKQPLGAYMETLKPKLAFRKWVHPADLHITLQFLGETPAAKRDRIVQAVRRATAAAAPIPMRIGSLGTFGRPAEPSILWIGAEQTSSGMDAADLKQSGEAGSTRRLEELGMLQKHVSRELEPLGFVPETRSFKPHITLARSYSGDRSYSASMHEGISGPSQVGKELEWTVDTLVLYESHLSRKPMYAIVAEAPLGQLSATTVSTAP